MKSLHTLNVLVDNESWILPHVKELICWITQQGLKVNFARHQDDLINCDVSFFIGCTKIVHEFNLNKSKLNLVIHESNLPQGKGFAPVAWQILDGKKEIPICLIEASKSADSGDIWLQDNIILTGQELYHEWREKQGKATLNICKQFINDFPNIIPKKQSGEESFYPRRSPKDSELSVDKTLKDQFDLLRTVDNEKFPAFFHYRGKTYKLEISEYESK